jgi:heme/copper-type cytochrome/quinol oxidase subunit 2
MSAMDALTTIVLVGITIANLSEIMLTSAVIYLVKAVLIIGTITIFVWFIFVFIIWFRESRERHFGPMTNGPPETHERPG